MTTKLQLTPEEIRIAIKKAHEKKPGVLLPVRDIYDSIAEAQVDKVCPILEKQLRAELNAEIRIELGSRAFEKGKKDERERIRVWGNQRCLDHHTSMNNVPHRDCNECWQALKEEK